MPELHDLLERRASRYEPSPGLFDRVLDRRRRRERNRRIRAGVVALVVAAAGIGVLVLPFSSRPTPAGDPRSPFLGTWVSTDLDGNTPTMMIRALEGEAVEIVVRDEFASVCSGAPSTMRGTGRLEGSSTLVVPSPVMTCDDGSEPEALSGPPLEEQLRNMTFVHDPKADALTDNFGSVWERVGGDDQSPEPTIEFLDGEVTFQAAPPWDASGAFGDQGPTWTELDGPYEGRVRVLADPLPIETGCREGPAPAHAQALARSIRSDPDLEATATVPADVGGVEALRMDVVTATGASICQALVLRPWSPASGDDLDPGDRMRLYVLDLPEGISARILAIAIVAPEARFERVVEAAAPIVDSFEFHTR